MGSFNGGDSLFHEQLQSTSLDEFIVQDAEAVEGLAAEGHSDDGGWGIIDGLTIFFCYDDVAIGVIARVEMQRHAVECGRGDTVVR